MIELEPKDFGKVRELFASICAHQMFAGGVLEGLYPGRVWADDADNPRTGFLKKDGWWFLAGDPHNATFNAALHRAIYDKTITGEKGWGGMLVCDSDGWDVSMPEIFGERDPITTRRLHYVCHGLDLDWRSRVPDGIEVRFADEALAESGIDTGPVEGVLNLRRGAEAPDSKAAAFVAIADGRIVAYASIDCMVAGGGDISVYTDGTFRRRGLAVTLSAALIEYVLAHGLDTVHWDCQSFNRGSVRTAETLGLELIREHTMYTLIFNPTIHEVNRAWTFVDAEQYEQALAACRAQIGDGSAVAHPHFHYIEARCYVALGRPQIALAALMRAAEAGWDSVGEAETDFAALTNDPAWPGIAARMEENARKAA